MAGIASQCPWRMMPHQAQLHALLLRPPLLLHPLPGPQRKEAIPPPQAQADSSNFGKVRNEELALRVRSLCLRTQECELMVPCTPPHFCVDGLSGMLQIMNFEGWEREVPHLVERLVCIVKGCPCQRVLGTRD
eukprot:5937624-Amphidinium_carterae.2